MPSCRHCICVIALPYICCWNVCSRDNHVVQRPADRHGHGLRPAETDDKIGTTFRNPEPGGKGGSHLGYFDRHIQVSMPDAENGRLQSKPIKTPADPYPAFRGLLFGDEHRKAGRGAQLSRVLLVLRALLESEIEGHWAEPVRHARLA